MSASYSLSAYRASEAGRYGRSIVSYEQGGCDAAAQLAVSLLNINAGIIGETSQQISAIDVIVVNRIVYSFIPRCPQSRRCNTGCAQLDVNVA